MLTSKSIVLTSTTIAALLFAACSHKEPIDDIHAQTRETKSWESVDISTFDQHQLIDRLKLLVAETNAAATADQPVEFHHLEVAFTPTLKALRESLADNEAAIETIDKLLPLAIKLHEAGHAANSDRGQKIAVAMGELIAKLETQL